MTEKNDDRTVLYGGLVLISGLAYFVWCAYLKWQGSLSKDKPNSIDDNGTPNSININGTPNSTIERL